MVKDKIVLINRIIVASVVFGFVGVICFDKLGLTLLKNICFFYLVIISIWLLYLMYIKNKEVEKNVKGKNN